MDPFIKSLLEGLCLIERDYSREALSEISPDLIKDGISDRCYRLLPIPFRGSAFYESSSSLGGQLDFLFVKTQHNPLMLYTYVTYVQFRLLKDFWEGNDYKVIPSAEQLKEFYDLAFEESYLV